MTSALSTGGEPKLTDSQAVAAIPRRRHPTLSMPPETGNGDGHHHPKGKKELAVLSLGALGVVYGDIGTSPLYAIKECLGYGSPHGVVATQANVLGVISLVFWALTLIVVIKYLTFVLRADNRGEGGILALAALVRQTNPAKNLTKLSIPILLALFGAGLLYGDGAITPAISILGAMEGIAEKSPALRHLIVPITVTILVVLFAVQRIGTGKIGSVFGWIVMVWFTAIAIAGVPQIIARPDILHAINPIHGIRMIAANGWHSLALMGSVVLVVTGAEALYADMGHFGRKPIRLAWYLIAFPALLLNYFGQGALFLQHPETTNPFYALVDGPMLVPMIILATMAAVIASQALISGVFSLTHQAIQLGYAPRLTVVHTSEKAEGQIYIPEINYLLMVACIALVIWKQNSSALAGAYGIAVTGTMAITTYLMFIVGRRNWHKPLWQVGTFVAIFLIIDLGFLFANLPKIPVGGWFPLVVGIGVFVVFTTWWRGKRELATIMDAGSMPSQMFLKDIAETKLPRVSGTAVFMTSNSDGIPGVLLHHVKHNKVLHRQVVLLSVATSNSPWVAGNHALEVRPLEHGFYRVIVTVGFMQSPNVPRILARCGASGLTCNEMDTTYYLGRQTLVIVKGGTMARWRKWVFALLLRNARPATSFFQVPPNRVVELGLQIEL